MRRRRFVQSLVAVPAAPALAAQLPQGQPAPGVPTNPAQPVQPPTRAAEEVKLEVSIPDAATQPVPRFFNATQFAALRRLSDLLMPRMEKTPGALDAAAPEFLDFLISEAPAERKQLYQGGLNALNAQATRQFHKGFGELDDSQANTLLAPLRQPWTYKEPADPLARFLRAAKQDIRTATVNSREYAAIAGAAGQARAAGGGLYWYPLD